MKLNQKGSTAIVGLLAVILILAIGGVGYMVYTNQKNKNIDTNNSTSTSNEPTTSSDQLEIKEWGVHFPATKVGKFSAALSSNEMGSTPQQSIGAPDGMQYVYIDVTGFTKDENKCANPNSSGSLVVVGAAPLYRHKDKNPVIKYQGKTKNLDPAAEVQIGDWWYSTTGLSDSGNCFDGITQIPQDYQNLRTQFLDNFKKISSY